MCGCKVGDGKKGRGRDRKRSAANKNASTNKRLYLYTRLLTKRLAIVWSWSARMQGRTQSGGPEQYRRARGARGGET
eukprot:scaffold17948_cov135-Isochrysis_galbana.AAC.3